VRTKVVGVIYLVVGIVSNLNSMKNLCLFCAKAL